MQEKRIVGKYSRLRKSRDESQKKTDAGYVQGLANWILWLDRSYLWQRSEIVKQCTDTDYCLIYTLLEEERYV